MNRKQDSELQIIQKEIDKRIRRQLATTTTARTITFSSPGGSGGGIGGNGGSGGGVTVITFNVYGADGAALGETTLVTRSRVDGSGMVWLEDDPGNLGVIIHAEIIQDPMYWATMSSI